MKCTSIYWNPTNKGMHPWGYIRTGTILRTCGNEKTKPSYFLCIIRSPQGDLHRLHTWLYYGPCIIKHIPIPNQWRLPQGLFSRGLSSVLPSSIYVMRRCDWSKFVHHLEMFLLYFAALFCRCTSDTRNLQITLFWYLQHVVIGFCIYNDIPYSHFPPMWYYFHFQADFCLSLSSSVSKFHIWMEKKSYLIHCACTGSVPRHVARMHQKCHINEK